MQEKYKERYFYDRFVDEERIKSFHDNKVSLKYSGFSFFLDVFSFEAGMLPILFGYNFENLFAQAILGFSLFWLSLALFLFILLIRLENKYKVFKSRIMFYLVYSVYFMFTISMAVSAIFTARFQSNPDGGFRAQADLIYLFLLFFPLHTAYDLFSYYAFLRCFFNRGEEIKGLCLQYHSQTNPFER